MVEAYRNHSSQAHFHHVGAIEPRSFGIWDRNLGGVKSAHVLEQLAPNGERGGWTNSNKLTLGRIEFAQTAKQQSTIAR